MGLKIFSEHINESNKIKDSLRSDIKEFLKRESIMGYTDDIISIIEDEPSESVEEDILDSFSEEGIELNKEDIGKIEPDVILERYLRWNGINGYSEAILNIAGKSKAERYKERDLLKYRGKYYYRPNKGDSTIWLWDNKETEGIPDLIKVDQIYNTPTYFGKNYYKGKESDPAV